VCSAVYKEARRVAHCSFFYRKRPSDSGSSQRRGWKPRLLQRRESLSQLLSHPDSVRKLLYFLSLSLPTDINKALIKLLRRYPPPEEKAVTITTRVTTTFFNAPPNCNFHFPTTAECSLSRVRGDNKSHFFVANIEDYTVHSCLLYTCVL
jgi:hypothetical protein